MARFAMQDIHDALRGDASGFRILGADKGVGLVEIRHNGIDHHNRLVCLVGQVDRVGGAFLVVGVQNDGVHAPGDEVFGLRDLILGLALGVGFDQVNIQFFASARMAS